MLRLTILPTFMFGAISALSAQTDALILCSNQLLDDSIVEIEPIIDQANPIHPKTLEIIETAGFSADSLFYRWTLPNHIVAKSGDRFFVRGTRTSGVRIIDHYGDGQSKRAAQLDDPSIGVLHGSLASQYEDYGPLGIEIRLSDVLNIGGKVYIDNGSASAEAFRFTIPEGKLLPVKVVRGNHQLANLGVRFNESLKNWNGDVIGLGYPSQPDGVTTSFAYDHENNRTEIKYIAKENEIHLLTIDGVKITKEMLNAPQKEDLILRSFIIRLVIKNDGKNFRLVFD